MTFSFGKEFRIQIFGESHGKCVGVTIDGCPPGIPIDSNEIQVDLNRRRPGTSLLTTSRAEMDQIEILSGVFNGKTTGAPITMIILNEDIDSTSYEKMQNTPRPGHADYTAKLKYSGYNDYRGGGIFSGRMTAALVMAGGLAKSVLLGNDINVFAHVVQIGSTRLRCNPSIQEIQSNVLLSEVRCVDSEISQMMVSEIKKAKKEGDSVGGIIECIVIGVPIGIGAPFFDSIESVISHAMFSIPGVKGIEFGSGFRAASMYGSENNDSPTIQNGEITWTKNDCGGILGGISNGSQIVFRIAIKPTPSISLPQQTIDLKAMTDTSIIVDGRHDPCIVPRAVPVVEGLAAAVITDLLLRDRIAHL